MLKVHGRPVLLQLILQKSDVPLQRGIVHLERVDVAAGVLPVRRGVLAYTVCTGEYGG